MTVRCVRADRQWDTRPVHGRHDFHVPTALGVPAGRVVNRGGRAGRRAARLRGRRRSADARSAVPVAIGSIIGSYEQSWQAGSRVAVVSGPVGIDSPGDG